MCCFKPLENKFLKIVNFQVHISKKIHTSISHFLSKDGLGFARVKWNLRAAQQLHAFSHSLYVSCRLVKPWLPHSNKALGISIPFLPLRKRAEHVHRKKEKRKMSLQGCVLLQGARLKKKRSRQDWWGQGLVKVLVKGPCFSSARGKSSVGEAEEGFGLGL